MESNDEFYSVTALYMTSKVSGEIIVEETESYTINYFDLNNLPEPMDREYKDCIDAYIKISRK